MKNVSTTPQAEQKPQTDIEATEDGILSCAAERVLGEVQCLTEPFQRRALQRALDSIEAKSPEGQADAEQTEPAPRLRLDKATADFRMVTQWLENRTIEEKLTGLAFSILIDGDVERSIRRRGLYEGDIGHDLDRDWNDAIAAVLETEAGRRSVSSEVLSIASYLMGVDAASY